MAEEFTLQCNFVDFAAYSFIPEKSKAIVCLVHGMGDHVGRHLELAHRVRDNGFAVFAMDLMGHGKSPGIRGNIGSREEVFGQLEVLVDHARKTCPGLPVFLAGHSMGGNIILAYRYIYPDADIAAYAALSPWLVLSSILSMSENFRLKLMERFFPNHAITNTHIKPQMLYKLAPGQAPPPPDNLAHLFITPKTFFTRTKDARLVLENAGIKAPPVFLTHGGDDGLCSVEGSRRFAEGAGSLCTYREYPGLYHETMHEAGWEERADELTEWFSGFLT